MDFSAANTALWSPIIQMGIIAGAILLGDRMSTRELLGCALMMAGVLLAQKPERSN